MYDVFFSNQMAQSNKNYVRLTVCDLERALAFASLLQKISTSEVKFEDFIIEPTKSKKDENEKK